MIMDSFANHLIGNLIIIAVFGLGAIGCFVAAIIMLVKPGEQDKNHPKYLIMDDDR
ncbi:hypothetical protein ABS757_08095 [Castellaniella sp. FW104-7G2B]